MMGDVISKFRSGKGRGGGWRARTVESDTGENETDDHTRCTDQHNPPPPDGVDPFKSDEREKEIGAGDDEADCGGLVEPDFGEEGGGVVHECVEAAELLEGLHAATYD